MVFNHLWGTCTCRCPGLRRQHHQTNPGTRCQVTLLREPKTVRKWYEPGKSWPAPVPSSFHEELRQRRSSGDRALGRRTSRSWSRRSPRGLFAPVKDRMSKSRKVTDVEQRMLTGAIEAANLLSSHPSAGDLVVVRVS